LSDLAIVGAGSWGTALSIVLAPRFHSVRLWAHDPGLAGAIRDSRENAMYLPGFQLAGNIEPTGDLAASLTGAGIVLLATPSQHLRTVLQRCIPHVSSSALFVSATKGIETASLQRMSEIVLHECPFAARIATLSGPTFASEIAKGEPAAVVIASPDQELACLIQSAFAGPAFRLYTNPDQIGVELGGALKNVIAIGAGICQGLGLGNNTLAALITRGLAEMTRLAVAAGANAATLSGLAGLGDLVLTCTGDLSRNRRVGIELGRGRSLPDILSSTKTVAEGVDTTFAAVQLAGRLCVEMPITTQMYAVLKEGKPPRDAIRYLMERTLKGE
jgi:glycerol-3-phosphate dehydrogenase (NAD(P)+)